MKGEVTLFLTITIQFETGKICTFCLEYFQICENGIVTFHNKYSKNAVPSSDQERTKFTNSDIVAPYFSNIDARTTGGIWYRMYSKTELASDTAVNDVIGDILTDAGYGSMEVFFLLVVTWADVKEYNQANTDVSH